MFTSYIICTNPRSGSTLLCDLLSSTGTTGKPNSYYHRQEFMQEWAAEWGLPNSETLAKKDFDIAYLSAAIKAGRAGTDIFGLRLQREYLSLLSGTLDGIFPGLSLDAERFERAFGKVTYIYLKRSDKVAQAVSLIKAELSGLWHVAPDGREIERLSAPQELVYDFERIHGVVETLEASDSAWNEWFEQERIDPMRLDYEAFSKDPAGTLVAICRRLGAKEPDMKSIRPGIAKLSDELSAEWIRRYKSDAARP